MKHLLFLLPVNPVATVPGITWLPDMEGLYPGLMMGPLVGAIAGAGVGYSCGAGLYLPKSGLLQVRVGQHWPGTVVKLQ